MLLSKNARLNIAYDSGEPSAAGFVRLSAVPIHDYSDELEYSKDGTLSFLSFSFERFKGGINHLICLGKGNLKDRLVIHLYVKEDGTIGNTKYYRGADERTSVYDYSSCESAEELQEKGIERLKELMSYTNMDMDLFNKSLSGMRGNAEDISIGDIVGGRDWDTGIYLSKRITRKIVAVKDGRESIEYKVGGNTLNRSTANAPAEPEDAYQKQIDALNDDLTKNTSDISENAENISKNTLDIQKLSDDISWKISFPSIERFDTLSDFVNHVSLLGRTYIGRAIGASWLPSGNWYRCWCILQNSPGGKYGVSGQIVAADGDKIYFGVINGITDFTATWFPILLKGFGDKPSTKLGNAVNGITFQYYKKGNVLTVYASGTLSIDIAAWDSIKSTMALPTSYRPSVTVYGSTSYPAADVIMRVGTDGYIYIQRASNTSGGKGNWFGFNASYGVDY